MANLDVYRGEHTQAEKFFPKMLSKDVVLSPEETEMVNDHRLGGIREIGDGCKDKGKGYSTK